MNKKRDIVSEISETKARHRYGYSVSELFDRIEKLEQAFHSAPKENNELLKYFPVSLVACMEGYFKLAIKELIDSGEPFLSNAEKEFADTKINLAIFKAIHGKKITFGEFISHTLSFSSLEEINKKLSALTNIDFLEKVKTVHNRFDVEVRQLTKVSIIKDSDRTISNTRKLFEIRHIICHELATEFEITNSDIEEQFKDCLTFLKASEELLTNILYPGRPLTQIDMNKEAERQMIESQEIIDDLMREAQKIIDKKNFQRLSANQKLWDDFSHSWADLNSNNHKDGSIFTSSRNGLLTEMANFRAKQILKYLKSYSSQ